MKITTDLNKNTPNGKEIASNIPVLSKTVL
jgi:hypothetical protein